MILGSEDGVWISSKVRRYGAGVLDPTTRYRPVASNINDDPRVSASHLAAVEFVRVSRSSIPESLAIASNLPSGLKLRAFASGTLFLKTARGRSDRSRT